MTANAVLWINHPNLLDLRVGGLSVLERQLWTIVRAGLRRVWVPAPKPPPEKLSRLRLPAEVEIIWSTRECETPYLGVSGDHFIRVETLRYLARAPYRAHTVFSDAAGATVVSFVPFRLEQVVEPQKQPLPPGSTMPIKLPLKEGPALDWLLAIGPKDSDGFMARNFDRHISLAVSRLLLDTAVTPNLMTVLSCALGLCGAALFLRAQHAFDVAGAALIWLHSVLDGCDGELARIRFQESPLGGNIDFWGDNLVHLSLFGCLGLGLSRAGAGPFALALGAAAAAGVLGSATLAFARRKHPESARSGETEHPVLARLQALLAQRDFIYLLLILAYFGRTYEFLWAGAVGSILFFMMLLYLGRDASRSAQTPNQGMPHRV